MHQGEIYRHMSGTAWHNHFQTPSQRMAVAVDATGGVGSEGEAAFAALAGTLALDPFGTLYIGADGTLTAMAVKVRMN